MVASPNYVEALPNERDVSAHVESISYVDVWSGTEYAGAVQIRDRLLGFDILGSTLVALVERPLDEDGVGEWAVDWYDIGEVEWGR